MKQSTFAAIIVFLAAATGALAAAWMYIRRREKELDEYEQLLFSEDFDEEPGAPPPVKSPQSRWDTCLLYTSPSPRDCS